MRPTVTTKHRELAEKIAADMEAYIANGGKVNCRRPDERVRPPVDHWQDRVDEGFRAHNERKAGRDR